MLSLSTLPRNLAHHVCMLAHTSGWRPAWPPASTPVFSFIPFVRTNGSFLCLTGCCASPSAVIRYIPATGLICGHWLWHRRRVCRGCIWQPGPGVAQRGNRQEVDCVFTGFADERRGTALLTSTASHWRQRRTTGQTGLDSAHSCVPARSVAFAFFAVPAAGAVAAISAGIKATGASSSWAGSQASVLFLNCSGDETGPAISHT